MTSESERKYREMIAQFRQIQQRFEMATTIEDRKAVLEEMLKLNSQSLAYLSRNCIAVRA